MLVIAYAVAIYAYLFLIGWGPACLILPASLQTCRIWLAPWMGSMMAAVVLVWLSRLGIDAATATYILTVLGVLAGGWTFFFANLRRPVNTSPALPFSLATIATLSLILISLLRISVAPTTISAGNNDPVPYIAAADFLKHGSTAHLPASDSRRLTTVMINNWKATVDRPGAELQISLFAQLFHVPSYRVFSILLAVMFAATVPLAGIFANSMEAGRSASLLTLALSVFNVYQLFWYYQGYAPQLLSQGCVAIFFILLARFESEQENYFRYATTLGILITVISSEYPEGLPFILVPYGIYLAANLVLKKRAWRGLLLGYLLPIGIGVAIDPVTFWRCVVSLRGDMALLGGWVLPRWALPADVIGLTNFNFLGVSHVAAIVLSVPVLYFVIAGLFLWPNRRLTVSILLTLCIFVFQTFVYLDYSYGYHKILAVYSFVVIAAFATGLTRLLVRYRGIATSFSLERATIVTAVIVTFLQAGKVAKTMKYSRHVVTEDLAEIGSLRRLIDNHTVEITDQSYWNQMWQVYFLDPTPAIVTKPNGYFANQLGGTPTPDDYLLTDRDSPVPQGRQLLWRNRSYALFGPRLASSSNAQL
jgi:hypothetical protein